MKIDSWFKYVPEFWRQDKLILVSYVSASVVNIILWILILSKFGFSSDPAPLHFSVVYGINHVGPAYHAYQLPFTGLVVLLLNWFLAKLFFERSTLTAYFLSFSSTLVQLLLLLATISLLTINT